MALTTGTRLGPYDIVSALGAGGMGEVYRARDTRLKRDVAIKVLPEAFATDPDRLAMFQREAELLATLNHPNIAHIHGLEESSGVVALVMELVEGPTLAELLTGVGRALSVPAASGAPGMPDPIGSGLHLEEAIAIAKQIAYALEAAREKGIVHRDLKPANVKVREDGTAKVLDFGLARMLESERPASSLSMSPTITSPAMMTGAGVILGTAAYMSPEQARGKPVDRRSDIWAFGCVLSGSIEHRPELVYRPDAISAHRRPLTNRMWPCRGGLPTTLLKALRRVFVLRADELDQFIVG